MERQDSAPDPRNPRVSPPALLQLPQSTVAPKPYPAEQVHRRFQDATSDPEEFRRKNVEHATRMGVDAEAYLGSLGLRKMRVVLKGTPKDNVQMADVQMEDATGTDYDVSTPGSDPWSDDAMLVEPSRPEIQANVMQPRKQNENAQTAKTKGQTKKKQLTLKEKRERKEKVRQNLANPPKTPVPIAAGTSSNGSAGKAAAITGPMEQTPSLFVEQVVKYPVLELPKWYTDISLSNLTMKALAKKRPPSLTSLESLKNCIGRCEEQMQSDKRAERKKLSDCFNELRDHVHKAEFLAIDKYQIKTSRILTVVNGLPRIFKEHTTFPWDLQADAYQLYLRWMRADFEHDVLRGIITVKGPNRGSDRLEPKYKNEHPPNTKRYGDEGLVLGQCWPSQLCTVRDGAHGSSQGGIFGEKEKGTYSIVLSGGGGYNDRDDGDTIVYSGTEGKNFTPTEATQQMITSCTLGNVIRVIRSHQLPTKNPYRPEIGLRYDGLYQAKGHTLVDNEKQTYLFTLERCPGQEKIRYGNGPEGRPTRFEIAEYKKLKEKI